MARALLGTRLVREPDGDAAGSAARRVGRIVEVEAYVGEADRASHARFGHTRRTAPMFGLPGFAYVYLVYGMHVCLNIVTEPAGSPVAVLIRAVEPIDGVSAMRAARLVASARRRGDRPEVVDDQRLDRARRRLDATPVHRLAAGPGLVGAAFGLTTAFSGLDLLSPGAPLRLEAGAAEEPRQEVIAGPRIGIGYAGPDWSARPWRLWIAGHPSLSRPQRDAARGGLPAGRG